MAVMKTGGNNEKRSLRIVACRTAIFASDWGKG